MDRVIVIAPLLVSAKLNRLTDGVEIIAFNKFPEFPFGASVKCEVGT